MHARLVSMTLEVLAMWIIGGATAVGGYFALQHLALRYIAWSGGHFSVSASSIGSFSTEEAPATERPGMVAPGGGDAASPSAVCGDGGGACGGGGGD
jgi:hypothetical protein